MIEANGKHNGAGNGHDPEETREDNIVHIPTLAERDRMRREHEKQEKLWRGQYRAAGHEPMINLPPVTKAMLALMIGIHVILTLTLDKPDLYHIWELFGFVPAYYTVAFPGWPAFVGPFSYMLLHGSWLHIGLNSAMLMAFASGVEKWMGGRRMLLLFVLSSLAAVLFHFILAPTSGNVVIGASGGLSGLFAGVLIMLQSQGRLGTGRYGIWPFAGLWIGLAVVFGLLGGPDGSVIAWAAHIGGFLAGLLLIKPILKIR